MKVSCIIVLKMARKTLLAMLVVLCAGQLRGYNYGGALFLAMGPGGDAVEQDVDNLLTNVEVR